MRTLLLGFFFCSLLVFYGNLLFSQCPAPLTISIDTILTTESFCQASGTAKINVNNGVRPYTYSIISGPVIVPVQSDSIFQSLSAGSYIVKATDNCNVSVTKNFTIPGSYNVPEINAITKNPTCQDGSDGSVMISVTGGRAPYSYALISPSPVISGPQSANTFTNLPNGTFSYRVSDSCGNYQTGTFTLAPVSGDFVVFYSSPFHIAVCDSFALPVSLSILSSFNQHKLPYSLKFTSPDGSTITHLIDSSHFYKEGQSSLNDTFYFRFHHVTGRAETFTVNAINVCGQTRFTSGTFYNLDLRIVKFVLLPDCSGQYEYTFDTPDTAYCKKITYTLVNPSGVVVASQINNAVFSHFPAALKYKIIRENCCSKDTLLFDWDVSPKFKIISCTVSPYPTNREGTTAIKLSFSTISSGILIIKSGPPSITFMDGTIKFFNYPDTITKNYFGGNKLRFDNINLLYCTTGTYKIVAVDSCGNRDSVTVTVNSSQLRHSTFSSGIIQGCSDDNKVVWKVNSNTANTSESDGHVISSQLANPVYFQWTSALKNTDTIVQLKAATYILNYGFSSSLIGGSFVLFNGFNLKNDQIIDTVVVPPYKQPAFINSPAMAVCNGQGNVVLLPDSTSGIPPYRFKILSGPSTTAFQSSPTFSGLTKGSYTFLMEDACGNSYSSSVTVDTLAVPVITTIGNTCLGGNAIFKAPSNPYYTYQWQRPNGIITSGDSLVINSMSSLDTGAYKITVTSNIEGCISSKSEYLNLRFCSPIPVKLLTFNSTALADYNLLKWQTENEINNDYFILEKSIDGITFFSLKQVIASGMFRNSYEAIDNSFLSGNIFYRLKIVNKNGSFSYSDIIRVCRENEISILLAPNPVRGILFLQFRSTSNSAASIQVSDISGRIILKKYFGVTQGVNNIQLNTHSLEPGTYILSLQQKDFVKSLKFVKSKS